MIRSILRPRHTLLSVAMKLEDGLECETMYLNDKDLIEAGYEIHEFHEDWYLLLTTSLNTFISIIMIFMVFRVIESYFILPNLYDRWIFNSYLWPLLFLAAILVPFMLRVLAFPVRKRLITKRSSQPR